MTTMTVAEQVTQELNAMKECGIRITGRMLAYVKTNEQEMQEFRDGCMSISEIADYVVTVAR